MGSCTQAPLHVDFHKLRDDTPISILTQLTTRLTNNGGAEESEQLRLVLHKIEEEGEGGGSDSPPLPPRSIADLRRWQGDLEQRERSLIETKKAIDEMYSKMEKMKREAEQLKEQAKQIIECEKDKMIKDRRDINKKQGELEEQAKYLAKWEALLKQDGWFIKAASLSGSSVPIGLKTILAGKSTGESTHNIPTTVNNNNNIDNNNNSKVAEGGISELDQNRRLSPRDKSPNTNIEGEPSPTKTPLNEESTVGGGKLHSKSKSKSRKSIWWEQQIDELENDYLSTLVQPKEVTVV